MGQLGYGSDMIEVSMSAGDSPDLSINVLHYAVIGNGAYVDQVRGTHGFHIGILMNLHPVQPDPHIHYYNIFSYLYRRHVAANLIIASDGDYRNILHFINSL